MTGERTPSPQPPRPTTDPDTGRDRLVATLRRAPRRGQVLVGVLLAALGLAAAVQVRLTHTSDDFAGERRQDLIQLLDSLSAAADRTQSQIEDLQRTRSDLRTSSERRTAALDEERERLDVLGILTGTVPAVGPGVTVTIDDPQGAVTAALLLNGVEELRDAGAEAIEINDRVRVVASTAFTERNGVLFADQTELRPPYVIDAIGSAHTLSEAVVFPGGLSDEARQVGATADVEESDVVQVGSLHTPKPPEYARPTGG